MERPKLKHNKKRNTAFLYEALVRELTKAILEKNDTVKNNITSIMKEFFSAGKPLARELDVYRTLYETKETDKDTAKALIAETKRVYFSINQNDVFNEQSKLISKVNKDVGKAIFQTFMPNYRNLATISQIFDLDVPIKTRVILEQNIVEFLTTPEQEAKQLEPIDNIVYKTFINKFNDKYGSSLLEEQKTLLTRYIVDQEKDLINFSVYLYEEIGRIKSVINTSDSIKTNKNYDQLLSIVEGFKERPVDAKLLEDVLYLQVLVKEAQ